MLGLNSFCYSKGADFDTIGERTSLEQSTFKDAP
jgi:hypothetical protein